MLFCALYLDYSKTCVNSLSQKDPKMVFKTDYHLMQLKSIAECSKGVSSIFEWPFYTGFTVCQNVKNTYVLLVVLFHYHHCPSEGKVYHTS